MNFIKQTIAVTMLNLRTIPQRLGSSGVAIVGIAGVVIVLVSVLSIAQGFAAAMEQSGSDSRALVMRSGADSEMTSGLGGARSRHHQAGARPAPRRPDRRRLGRALRDHRHPEDRHQHPGQRADARRRAAGDRWSATSSRIVEGRMFEFGTNEVVVGRGASGQLPGPDRRQHDSLRTEHLAGGRHVRDRRQHRRDRNLVRLARAAGRVSPRQHAIKPCWRGSIRARASTRSATG